MTRSREQGQSFSLEQRQVWEEVYADFVEKDMQAETCWGSRPQKAQGYEHYSSP